jgi:pyruvate formate-lyase activating enzyme-like uncharacterized protein
MAILWAAIPVIQPQLATAIEQELWNAMFHEVRLHLHPNYGNDRDYLANTISASREKSDPHELKLLEKLERKLGQALRDLHHICVIEDLETASQNLESVMRREIYHLHKLREVIGQPTEILDCLERTQGISEQSHRALHDELDAEDQIELTGRGLKSAARVE